MLHSIFDTIPEMIVQAGSFQSRAELKKDDSLMEPVQWCDLFLASLESRSELDGTTICPLLFLKMNCQGSVVPNPVD